ncbi:MAG: M28 family metallopeptidase [Flavobacteriaceae bacterium]|nr:M28 family metallopeptidase [Flavobacteriaceae bacterium]
MKKINFFNISGLLLMYTLCLGGCYSAKEKVTNTSDAKTAVSTPNNPEKYAATITSEELKEHLYIFASDSMQGRFTGSEGQKKAAEYIVDFYKKEGIAGPTQEANAHFQSIPASYFTRSRNAADSENVLGFIKGSEFPDEVIVLSAHYDHVGVDKDGNVFNGADDDGSGSMALLEIAEAFNQAAKEGKGPRRSVLILHVTGEEIGLYGSKYYTDNPIFPLANTVANLNIDMIGRIDPDKGTNDNYVYLIGSDRLSMELHQVSEKVNEQFVQMELDYKYNAPNDPNRFYFRSDHYNFAKNNIPVIFYFNGVHEDYHKITDTPDKIEYDLLAKRAQLIFHTAWELANRDERIKLTENQD